MRAKMWRAKSVVLVLASVAAVTVEGAAEPDPRGFTEDPLDTEEKFRENGKTGYGVALRMLQNTSKSAEFANNY